MLASFDRATSTSVPAIGGATQRLWPSIFAVWLLWTILLFLATFANLYDLHHVGVPVNIPRQLSKFFVILLPWPLLSTGLMLVFSRQRASIRWQQAWKIFLVLMLVFLPLHIIYEHAYFVYRSHQHRPSWGEIMQKISPLQIWVDAMILLFTFSAHLAFSYWHQSRQQWLMTSQSRQEILALKLLQLRSHLEPYFLFSSLEGIENLLINAEGPMATRALARLSDLLRYVLESAQESELSIASEIGFLKDYVSLQNLRFANRLQLTWELEERDWSAHHIPPLLLYPLFDYAVRHMQTTLQHASGQLRIQAGIVQQVLHLRLDFSGDTKLAPVITEEIQAAQQRIALLRGEEAAIRFIDHAGSANFTHGIALDFPLTELSDA